MKYKLKNINLISLIIVITFWCSAITFLISLLLWSDISPDDLIGGYNTEVTQKLNKEFTVFIPIEFNNALNTLYRTTDKEFVFCLYGDIEADKIFLKNMIETDILSRTSTNISYVNCQKTSSFLGTVHSHPTPKDTNYIASCGLSKQDVATFVSNSHAISGVICGENKLGWYNLNSLETSYNYEIINNQK